MYTLDNISFWQVILIILLVLLIVWSGIWKGFALYRAGRVKDPVWFVVLFLVNTVGILEILYLFVFSKRASRQASTTQP